MSEHLDPHLAQLFREYRDALPDPEPSATFTPGLWQRIEARQKDTLGFRRLARAIITAAAAASLLMAAWLIQQRPLPVTANNTYLELLAAGESRHDNLDDIEIVQHERSR